jgi:hypothetical protein
VDQKREDEKGRNDADAAEQRRAVVPANPDRREPDDAGEDGKIAHPPNRPQKRSDKSSQNQRYAGSQGEGCGEARASGIGGVPPWAFGNGERAQCDGECCQPGGEPCLSPSLHRHSRHA